MQITKWDQGTSDEDSKGAFYHVTIPGFTVKEFTSYLHKLRKGKEPRPFSSYSRITEVPFVLNVHYFESEIADVIKSLSIDGTIKSINDVFPGEARYDLANESLLKFIKDMWRVHEYNLILLFNRIIYCGKPQETDKDYLELVYGKRITDRILSNAYHTRKMNKNSKDREEEKKAKKFVQIIDKHRKSLIEDIRKRHENIIKNYEILSKLIEGISFSPLVPRSD